MALDGKILAQAKNKLEEKRRQRDEEQQYRLGKIYTAVPRIRELDTELRLTMAELVGAALGVDATLKIDDIRVRNLKLQEERQKELQKAGYPCDYLDDKYMCSSCRDTGYIDSTMCVCLEEIYKKEQGSSLSNLFKLGNETFESFDLSYYNDSGETDASVNPRQSMKIIYEICTQYARNFGSNSMNLFFNGAPGLGKTFLSACIARVVAENGFSVVYNTAMSVFSEFETVKFMRSHDSDESREEVKRARSEVKRFLECDLLIIDDLGTEMTTAFTMEVLYDIINTRLLKGKKTLINSNLTIDELRRRYSVQILARLEGEYQVLTFYGSDIRKKKNMV